MTQKLDLRQISQQYVVLDPGADVTTTTLKTLAIHMYNK
jgi:hypothetical protein